MLKKFKCIINFRKRLNLKLTSFELKFNILLLSFSSFNWLIASSTGKELILGFLQNKYQLEVIKPDKIFILQLLI